jgi:hypothetical protein
MYHVYKTGYSTLPDLKKINFEDVFEKNRAESSAIQVEKHDSLANQNYFFEYRNDPEFYKICQQFILKYYPCDLKSKNYLDIAKEIDEDLIIHRTDSEKDYVSSIHVCLPSSWSPEDKIGKNFKEIHRDVPMNLKNSNKIVKAIMHGSFERFVWSVIFEKKYNYHPRFKKENFNSKNPKIFIKVERQVTVGFGDFCLFILRQYLIEEEKIDKKFLYESLKNMTLEQREYKGLKNIESILEYLS